MCELRRKIQKIFFIALYQFTSTLIAFAFNFWLCNNLQRDSYKWQRPFISSQFADFKCTWPLLSILIRELCLCLACGLVYGIFTCVGSVTLNWFDLHDQHKTRGGRGRLFTADLRAGWVSADQTCEEWVDRVGQNIGAVRWFAMMVDMIYWDQVSWKDPLIISSSQERLHYTGNCFYFIWPHLFLTDLITDITRDVWELM